MTKEEYKEKRSKEREKLAAKIRKSFKKHYKKEMRTKYWMEKVVKESGASKVTVYAAIDSLL